MTGGFNHMSTPLGGTFTANYRHGTSDPVAYNAPAGLVSQAVDQATERDAVITAEHQADPAAAEQCRVCNPVDTSEYFRPDTWRDRLGRITWRARRVWWAITAPDDADWFD